VSLANSKRDLICHAHKSHGNERKRKGGEKEMEKKYMERLIGKYCKIVTKEPGEDRASVVTGTLEDVDYKDGFILVDSEQGLGCLRINTIVAIKPGHKRNLSKRKIKDEDQAMVGIGTLIIFIAMVLIAAVASSVLITTSETLQSRAKSVGTQTIREVSAGVSIESITGYTNTDNTSVFFTPVDTGSNFTIMDNSTATQFGCIAIHDPDTSITRTQGMNSGDRCIIIINLSAIIPETSGLPAREAISGTLTPEIGIKSQYDVTAPAVFSKRIVALD